MPLTQKGIEKGRNNAMEYALQAARANNKNAKWKMRFGNARSGGSMLRFGPAIG